MIGSTVSSSVDSLTSLADDRPEVTSSWTALADEEDVLLVATSSDVHDMSAIVQLTHGNIIALWTQLRYHVTASSYRPLSAPIGLSAQ